MSSTAYKIERLKESNRRLRERLVQQDDIIKSLREALRHLVNSSAIFEEEAVSTSDKSDKDTDTDMEDAEEDEESSDSDDTSQATEEDASQQDLPTPFYDKTDRVFRCVECGFEVCDGACQNSQCREKHAYEDEPDGAHGPPETFNSVLTEDSFFHSDRNMAPRGTTPLLEDAAVRKITGAFSPGYTAREYSALIARGATPAMVEAFTLSFTDDEGIVAWADDQLFTEYSNDLIYDGESWKIHLGRRIYLDRSDVDGSIFIEELLDEIMHTPRPDRWETVQKGDTWITRPVAAAIKLDANGDDNDMEYIPDGRRVDSDSEVDCDSESVEHAKRERAVAASRNPLLLQDDYENDEIEDEDAAEDMEQEDAAEDSNSDTSSNPNWPAPNLTENKETRCGGGDDSDEDEESNLSSEPGSDWDSNDGIE